MIKKVFPDKERVKSILKLVKEREKFTNLKNVNFPTLIAESYYEIIKELGIAILLLDGLKAVGENAHKEIIDFLIRYKEISDPDIILLQDLRRKRNKSMYEGKQIEESYLKNKKEDLKIIIKKLKIILEKR